MKDPGWSDPITPSSVPTAVIRVPVTATADAALSLSIVIMRFATYTVVAGDES